MKKLFALSVAFICLCAFDRKKDAVPAAPAVEQEKPASLWIEQPAYPDAMPVDISFVFEDEKPAGKHGFMLSDGETFRFEDGTPVRFWGVNFNGGACFPPKDYAPKVAARLSQAGCNIVRLHQMDAEFDTPNLYGFTKGKRVTDTDKFDPRSMDALDYLIYCLKNEGIYVYMDMCTYRHYKEEDNVAQHELLRDGAKPWNSIDSRLIELQKEFATRLWTHYNPYTGLCYKDDPAIVLTEIANESDFFGNNPIPEGLTYYKEEFKSEFRQWLTDNGLSYDWDNFNFRDMDPVMIRFKVEFTTRYYKEMREHLRSIGVKVPVAGTNWTRANALAYANASLDFTDGHNYFYDWRWNHTDRRCANRPITGEKYVFPPLAVMRTAGKPFFVSEWDMPWPNMYRAEGPIYYAAVGALQGWSGFAIHTYAYGCRLEDMKILGKEQSSPVGGIPYREGIFSTWNDPAKFGLFYHAALIMRRQDVHPTGEKVAVLSQKYFGGIEHTAFQGLLEQKTSACVYDTQLPAGYSEMVDIDKPYPMPEDRVQDAEGQMWRDFDKGIGAIDTDRTAILYGRIGESGTVDFKNGLKISASTDFGVIALSSLSDESLCRSKNILLSAIGRAENTDAVFDGDRMVERGTPPILAEVIEAQISFPTPYGESLHVWGVNPEGYYTGQAPVKYEDGVFSFKIGDVKSAACYYLIVAD